MMVPSSQQQTGKMTVTRQSTVLSGTAGVGGGMGTTTATSPILTVCTTTHPVPQIELGFSGGVGMVINIP